MSMATVIRPDPSPISQPSPFVPRVQPPSPFTLVLFGATGDLATRKLIPSLFGLWQKRFLPRTFAIVGVGRRASDEDAFRQEMRAALSGARNGALTPASALDGFLSNVFYHRADFTAAGGLEG